VKKQHFLAITNAVNINQDKFTTIGAPLNGEHFVKIAVRCR
jgi:hypothetical protein